QITQTDNSVGASSRIVIRGNKSISGGNEALVVIDNVISSASVLAQLPPEVIEKCKRNQRSSRCCRLHKLIIV
ncbi:hypothetical protein, partial [Chryseobacterium sp. CH1]|uniref:hypothetical protein n=1 Tax=Chryseobacterium sp. CH1 TaxID=713551 RepID=UPI001E35A311